MNPNIVHVDDDITSEKMSKSIVEASDICKKYGSKTVLSHISFSIQRSEYVCIVGKSGAGKTTLLNIIGLIEKSDSGNLLIDGRAVFSRREILQLRRTFFGYIFQDYLLMTDKSVRDNLAISLYGKERLRSEEMKTVLRKVGLDGSYLDKKICCLSGGEQQRISLARMMLKPYELVLADEPTGNLDCANRNKIIEIFKNLKMTGKTIVCVTHDREVAASADRIIYLEDNGTIIC